MVLWFKHIDTKYYTLTTGLSVIIIYLVIFISIGVCKLNKKLLRLLWTMHDEDDDIDLLIQKKNERKKDENGYSSLSNNSSHKTFKKHRRQSGVGNLGLNASVKEFQLEKKLGRRMISHNTQKAKQATHKLVVINTSPTTANKSSLSDSKHNNDNNKQEMEIIKNEQHSSPMNINHNNLSINDKSSSSKQRKSNKMSGLSTSLLQSDDEDDAQIL